MNKQSISALSALFYLTVSPLAIAAEGVRVTQSSAPWGNPFNATALTSESEQPINQGNAELARRGGSRSGGRSGGFSRSSAGARGSGRVNRSSGVSRTNRSSRQVSRPSGGNRSGLNLNSDRNRSNRIQPSSSRRPSSGNRVSSTNRPSSGNRAGSGQTISRPNAGDRIDLGNRPNSSNRVSSGNRNVDRNRNTVGSGNRNVDRNRIDNRDLNLSNDRNFSNRVDRSRTNVGNRANIGNSVDINRGDRNVVVNPRGYGGGWGWNGGSVWYPSSSYWGGGFWGSFAIGAVTGGLIGAAVSDSGDTNVTNVENNYYTVEEGSPGYTLLSDYGLTQTSCSGSNLVVISGPEDSVICATPSSTVPAGNYAIDTETLTIYSLDDYY